MLSVVDDCSTDRTGQIMDNYVSENHLEDRVTVIHNPKRIGMLENIYFYDSQFS